MTEERAPKRAEEHAHPHAAGDDHAHDHDHTHTHEPVEPASLASFSPGVGARGGVERCVRVLHIDPVAGCAGDMLLAAFLDLGVDAEAVREAIAATGISGFHVEHGRRERHAIAARSFDVVVDDEQPPRDYATIAELLAAAPLDPRVQTIAQRAFLRLGEAEAKIHRQPLERVHFHEVGGVDAIVDIVGNAAAMAWLEREAGGQEALGVSISALPLGGGRARGAHGRIPIPAPAALELLVGLPVRDAGLPAGDEVELVTPTGAALIRAFSELLPCALGRWPAFTLIAVGYGAGRRSLADRPNVVRLVLGAGSALVDPRHGRAVEATHTVLETNVDDATGEVAGAAIEALLGAGALDAWAQPITMKKGRPAMTLGAIVVAERAEELGRVLLAQTGSLGVRMGDVRRIERPRRWIEVETRYGAVRVKIADGDGLAPVVHPELDACRAVAAAHGVPVREVIRAAIAAVPLV